LIRVIDLSVGQISTIAGSGFFDGNIANPDGDLPNNEFRDAEIANIRPADIMKVVDNEFIFSDIGSRKMRRLFVCENPKINAINTTANDICQGQSVTLSVDGNLNDAEQ